MADSALTKKLYIKTGQRITIMNPPVGYMDLLGELRDRVELETHGIGEFDFVHLFVNTIDELEEIGPGALKAVKYDGILWVSYPKKSSGVSTDISRDVGWDIMAKNGLRPVAGVSINEVWSALRFRPFERVKSSKK